MNEWLINNVIEWAEQKGILDNSDAFSQAEKTAEEVIELMSALHHDDYHETVDAYGDIMVTLIIGAKLADIDLEKALESAYNVIKNRKGKMIDGKFVKER